MALSREQRAEIKAFREEKFKTRRPTVSTIEEILGKPIPVLDHGFIRVMDYMGDDSSVVQAARVSYGRGTKRVSEDRGLIRYLMRHRHTTPFEMCEIKFHVKLPIFVARQWIRHRTANVNEYSARYSILDKEFYVPDRGYLEDLIRQRKSEDAVKRLSKSGQTDLFGAYSSRKKSAVIAAQSTVDKQGRDELIPEEEVEQILQRIHSESNRAHTIYQKLLGEESGNEGKYGKKGIARELARIVVPLNTYTQWYWKIDLHNLLRFLSLRTDVHAQYEIRVYAYKISEMVQRWVPLTWEAFEDYVMGGAELSAKGLEVVKRMLAGEEVSQEESGINKREWRELVATLGREG